MSSKIMLIACFPENRPKENKFQTFQDDRNVFFTPPFNKRKKSSFNNKFYTNIKKEILIINYKLKKKHQLQRMSLKYLNSTSDENNS